MNRPPAFQFYADDFLGGTVAMTNQEKGMYITALCIQWNKGGISREDMDRLGRGMAVPSIGNVTAKFFLGKDGLFRNKRLEAERRKQRDFRENRRKSGEKGAKSRWHSHGTAIAQPMANGMAKHGSPSPSPSSIAERECPEAIGRPTRNETLAKAQFIGLAEWKANDWFDEMEGCGWLDHQHRPIMDWVAVLTRVCRKWESDGRPTSPPKPREHYANKTNGPAGSKSFDRNKGTHNEGHASDYDIRKIQAARALRDTRRAATTTPT